MVHEGRSMNFMTVVGRSEASNPQDGYNCPATTQR